MKHKKRNITCNINFKANLKQSVVFFLFVTSDQNFEDIVYIGQTREKIKEFESKISDQ